MILVLLLLGIATAIFIYKYVRGALFLKRTFRNNNVITYGVKGAGKDLITQRAIQLRNEPYYSNISYGYKWRNINLADISLAPNTYHNFINGNIEKIEKNNDMEGIDIYISDAGVYLPSQYDNLLNKTYPSMPIYYALSRHLYNQNIHFNTQALNRVWLKLREQADHYIKVIGTIKLPFFFITKVRYYNRYETAQKNILPMSTRGFNNETNRAMIEQHNALYGAIKEYTIITPKHKIKYDTRAFGKKIFK